MIPAIASAIGGTLARIGAREMGMKLQGWAQRRALAGAATRYVAKRRVAGGRVSATRSGPSGATGRGLNTNYSVKQASLPVATPVKPTKPRQKAEPAEKVHESASQRRLNAMWSIDTSWSLAERMTSLIGSNAPTFQHSIMVTVVGGPEADIRRVWYLACATAFGRFRRRATGIAETNMEAVWDISGKSCRVSIGYSIAGWPNVLLGIISGKVTGGSPLAILPGYDAGKKLAERLKKWWGKTTPPETTCGSSSVDGTRSGIDMLQEGPMQLTVGAPWPQFMRRGADGSPLGVNIPSWIKDTGYNPAWGSVVEDCNYDSLVYRFADSRPVDVYREAVRCGPGYDKLPYGRVTPIEYGGLLNSWGIRQDVRSINDKVWVTSPLLPDAGRVITTGEKRDLRVQPPKPWVDGKSRMSLVDMILTALHRPCYAPHSTGCDPGYLGHQAGDERLSGTDYNTPKGGRLRLPDNLNSLGVKRDEISVPRLGE